MKVITLLGAPGSGKGTVAEGVCGKLGYRHISTGQMMRDAVIGQTSVGEAVREYMQRHEYVPDDIIIQVVEDLVDGQADKAFMFDGFPRTLPQAHLFGDLLTKKGCEFFRVFFMDAPRETLLTRLTGRRICSGCGANYHIESIPPTVEGQCDVCNSTLYKRADDSESSILNRLEIYDESTQPLIDFYSEKDLLVRINSDQNHQATRKEFLERMKELEQL